jgi:acylpyruvate hydrolase
MKLAKFSDSRGDHFALVEGDKFHVLSYSSLTEALTQNIEVAKSSVTDVVDFDQMSLRNPFDKTCRIFCIGMNYSAHVKETGKPAPEVPSIFAKFPSTLADPYQEITLPESSFEVDWEVELGIVIGKSGKNLAESEALSIVAGYVAVNDISMRDWQSKTTQWFQGKNFEKTTPVGPYIVTPDELDHARALTITCEVNEETMQSGNTSDLIFGVPYLLSYISRFTTLLPGDLVITGTPGGVGMGRTPKRFLQAGETLTSSIEGIGSLKNRFVRTQ